MEDLLLEIEDEYYCVRYSARAEPNQMVSVWHKSNKPIAINLFDINYKTPLDQIKKMIDIYWQGYARGQQKGVGFVQDGIKNLLGIRS